MKGYRLPNGCRLRPGCRVRVPAKDVWRIPEEDIQRLGLTLEDDAATAGSEVVARPVLVAPEVEA